MFQHWHSGGGIVAHRYNCLGKGEVENVCEDACKLLSTCSEHTSQNAIRASSFARIDFDFDLSALLTSVSVRVW